MLRCASSFLIATYEKVGLIRQDSHALPLEYFTRPLKTLCNIIAAYAKVRLIPRDLCALPLEHFTRTLKKTEKNEFRT